MDLTGQVCADSIGHRIYSGIGGQMDFIRGAALSPGGQADHRAALDGGGRHGVADRGRAQARRRRGDHARPRALGGDGVRRREPARPDAAGARRAAGVDRASGLPGGAPPGPAAHPELLAEHPRPGEPVQHARPRRARPSAPPSPRRPSGTRTVPARARPRRGRAARRGGARGPRGRRAGRARTTRAASRDRRSRRWRGRSRARARCRATPRRAAPAVCQARRCGLERSASGRRTSFAMPRATRRNFLRPSSVRGRSAARRRRACRAGRRWRGGR
ncbi:MAG: hypothetical protein MZV64_30085 [Ignavibacteriales bacterium]|nr:hypothetical protein [Ignavibacteriales bacterium]